MWLMIHRDRYSSPVTYPTLRHLDIPTLVMTGDNDFVPWEVIAHIAEAIHGSRVEVLADCGHFPYLEQPEETRTIITAFMTSP